MLSAPSGPPLLALPGPAYFYRYDGDFVINGQPIIAHQEGGQGRGTAWAVWDAAAAAAKYLEAAATDLHSRHAFCSVVELGSGTGLAGLSAAAALQLPTLLTDLPEALPALQRNIAANSGLGQLVAAAPLDWRDPLASPALRGGRRGGGNGGGGSGQYGGDDHGGSGSRAPGEGCHSCAHAPPGASSGGGRLVLAADCVWLEELVQPFVGALEAVAGPPADRALLAYQSRSTRIDGLLFSLLERGFEVAPVPLLPGEPPRGPIDLYWLTPRPAAATSDSGALPPQL